VENCIEIFEQTVLNNEKTMMCWIPDFITSLQEEKEQEIAESAYKTMLRSVFRKFLKVAVRSGEGIIPFFSASCATQDLWLWSSSYLIRAHFFTRSIL